MPQAWEGFRCLVQASCQEWEGITPLMVWPLPLWDKWANFGQESWACPAAIALCIRKSQPLSVAWFQLAHSPSCGHLHAWSSEFSQQTVQSVPPIHVSKEGSLNLTVCSFPSDGPDGCAIANSHEVWALPSDWSNSICSFFCFADTETDQPQRAAGYHWVSG